MSQFIHIRTEKFPILPGEEDELVNEGMYGKALAQYLQAELGSRHYDAPFICCEDWGWWVELKAEQGHAGVCVYCHKLNEQRDPPLPTHYVVTEGALSRKKWSWSRFRFIDIGAWVDQLHTDLLTILELDPDIEVLGTSQEFPG